MYNLFKHKIGNLSFTKKMPCPSWSLSAFDCKSTDPICEKYCYARNGHYNFAKVEEPRRENSLIWLRKDWVKDFSSFIQLSDLKYFRWFDSGDLPNILLLQKICAIADQCPNTKFWLPTRAKEILKNYWEANNKVPLRSLHPNLIIRLSAPDVDQEPDVEFAKKLGINMAGVSKENYDCNAKIQGGKCGECRKCWDQKIKMVVYNLH